KEIKGFLEDSSLFYIHHMIGDRFIPFKSNSGDVFGLVDVNDNYGHKTYEKNVHRFIGNRFEEEFFYLQGYGDEMELFYNEVGPSFPESVKYFDEKITINNGVFHKDLLFYSY